MRAGRMDDRPRAQLEPKQARAPADPPAVPRPATGRLLPPLEQALGDKELVPKDPATVPVPPELLDALHRAGRVLIAVHVQPPPDGDGVGGALGLSRAPRACSSALPRSRSSTTIKSRRLPPRASAPKPQDRSSGG